MAKATITVSSRVYQPGSRSVVLPNLTTDDNGIKISLTRESWPDQAGAEILSGLIEGSDDGGATYYGLCVFGYAGGNMTNPKTGQPVTVCGPTVYWPERNINGVMTPQRPSQVRATLSNTVALQTAVTLDGV